LGLPQQCPAGQKSGATGASDELRTSGGIPFSVRTPSNYDPSLAHPLIVVFAPAGFDRFESERHAGLTHAATAHGFLIAYSDHRRLALGTFRQVGEIPALVAQRWCVDEHRISLTGHSDGGSTAAAVTFLGTSSLPPAAVVTSAAGISGQDFAANACPAPVSVLVIHSRADRLFPLPEYGRNAAQWWAACNRCAREPGTADVRGCVAYAACANGVTTAYCETDGAHKQWPPLNEWQLGLFWQARH
jgi:polyhydroxybutyrate depolymerase